MYFCSHLRMENLPATSQWKGWTFLTVQVQAPEARMWIACSPKPPSSLTLAQLTGFLMRWRRGFKIWYVSGRILLFFKYFFLCTAQKLHQQRRRMDDSFRQDSPAVAKLGRLHGQTALLHCRGDQSTQSGAFIWDTGDDQSSTREGGHQETRDKEASVTFQGTEAIRVLIHYTCGGYIYKEKSAILPFDKKK